MWATLELEYEELELITPKEGGRRRSLCKDSVVGGLYGPSTLPLCDSAWEVYMNLGSSRE